MRVSLVFGITRIALRIINDRPNFQKRVLTKRQNGVIMNHKTGIQRSTVCELTAKTGK